MHPVAFLHQQVYTPLPVKGGFNNYSNKFFLEGFQRLNNEFRFIAQLLPQDPLILPINDTKVTATRM